MLKRVFLFCLLLLSMQVYAQNNDSRALFQQVDDFARTVQYDGNLTELTNKLTSPYTDSIDKLRAIFIWITDNIAYDYKLYNSGSLEWHQFNCKGTKASCDLARIEWENKLLKHVLDKRKAVCNGYTKLFKSMCSIAGIQNEVVDGYVKQSPSQIGLALSASHSWNVIKLGGLNNYFDVTWAAGSCKKDEETDELLDFVKHYKDFYWRTPPGKFMRNHYPKSEKWIKEAGVTKENFFNAPYFYPNELAQQIELNVPETGLITAVPGDTVHFRFKFKKPIKNIQVNTNNYKNVEISLNDPAEWVNNIYQFDYVVKENSLNYIEILFDSQKGIRYKIKH